MSAVLRPRDFHPFVSRSSDDSTPQIGKPTPHTDAADPHLRAMSALIPLPGSGISSLFIHLSFCCGASDLGTIEAQIAHSYHRFESQNEAISTLRAAVVMTARRTRAECSTSTSGGRKRT
jgi:hypothetical protein